jgi:hypothetical protein
MTRPEAHIVNLSSMGGFVPVPGQTIYCAAKAAVKLMSEGLASELLNTNIRVTVVFPGAVATNIVGNSGIETRSDASGENGRANPLSATKAAEIIVNAIERNARHVYVGRDSSLMNILSRLNPSFAARAVAKKMNGLLPAAKASRDIGQRSDSTHEARRPKQFCALFDQAHPAVVVLTLYVFWYFGDHMACAVPVLGRFRRHLSKGWINDGINRARLFRRPNQYDSTGIRQCRREDRAATPVVGPASRADRIGDDHRKRHRRIRNSDA